MRPLLSTRRHALLGLSCLPWLSMSHPVWAKPGDAHAAHAVPSTPAASASAPPSEPRPDRNGSDAAIPMALWKDPNCGCCNDWVDHMQAHGFVVRLQGHGGNALRNRMGLPPQFSSCHTALVGGYLIEGHVPAADVHKLLQQKPKALGLSVPGMPIGSPGMDGPAYGQRKDPFDVLLLVRPTHAPESSSLQTQVFTAYR